MLKTKAVSETENCSPKIELIEVNLILKEKCNLANFPLFLAEAINRNNKVYGKLLYNQLPPPLNFK